MLQLGVLLLVVVDAFSLLFDLVLQLLGELIDLSARSLLVEVALLQQLLVLLHERVILLLHLAHFKFMVLLLLLHGRIQLTNSVLALHQAELVLTLTPNLLVLVPLSQQIQRLFLLVELVLLELWSIILLHGLFYLLGQSFLRLKVTFDHSLP